MTDRELLELAAAAAGFGDPQTGHICWTESEYPPKSGKQGALWNYVGHMDTAELWNPLTDDGDALRLAVKLSLMLDKITQGYMAGHWVATHTNIESCYELAIPDPYAATRRAIVRAASEIGRNMK